MILWFGWYGCNPGSTLPAMDFEGIGRVATNTTLAACAGALVAVIWVYPRSKKWDVGISINGLLAGLVAITAPCYWVSPTGSIAIGVVAAGDTGTRRSVPRASSTEVAPTSWSPRSSGARS